MPPAIVVAPKKACGSTHGALLDTDMTWGFRSCPESSVRVGRAVPAFQAWPRKIRMLCTLGAPREEHPMVSGY